MRVESEMLADLPVFVAAAEAGGAVEDSRVEGVAAAGGARGKPAEGYCTASPYTHFATTLPRTLFHNTSHFSKIGTKFS